jgi:acyl-CoA thioester hydrolase
MTITALNTQPSATHHHPIRVYYEDTDAGGIVYYANYLKFAERARTEMLREAGFHHTAMMTGDGIMLAVRRVTADYLRPAKLDDMLDVTTCVTGLGAATVDLDQIIRRNAEELCRVTVTIACVGRDGRPVRLPVDLRRLLSPDTTILKKK